MRITEAISERTLMQRVAAGDARAFEEVYERHARAAFLLARRLGAPRELAEEVVQEAFVSLWRRAGSYRADRGSLAAWLSTIVRNALTDAWRRAAARPVSVFDEHVAEAVAGTEGELGLDDCLAVREVVAQLPGEQREAIALSYFAGLTHEQIADTSGTPLGTVKGRLRLGMSKLRCSMAA